jgi:serine/threonine protein kinase
MFDLATSDDPLDDLTEEFARQWREGGRPSVEEFAARYPQWADELRAVLPAVVLMEKGKPRQQDRGPMPVGRHHLLPNRIGDYRIVRQIGRGGMGVVYEAVQETLNRRVALKVLPRSLLADNTVKERFRREARAAARLQHPNIVPVFEAGEAGEDYFYVMQLIDGQNLDQVIGAAPTMVAGGSGETSPGKSRIFKQGGGSDTPGETAGPKLGLKPRQGTGKAPLVSLSPGSLDWCRSVARLCGQVARALAYAHAQGIVHRDIKPSNLLLDRGGNVWVTDFGVAKLVEEANLTGSGEYVGTLKYMAPEQFAGKCDARADVYGLGVTLYELLTLRPAFPDTVPQHLIQLITQEARVPPRTINPAIPLDLETIVLKALARDPDRRYQTAEELGDDLRRFLSDQPIQARRAGPLKRGWQWCRRNRALTATLTTTFLLLVAVTVVSAFAFRQEPQPAPPNRPFDHRREPPPERPPPGRRWDGPPDRGPGFKGDGPPDRGPRFKGEPPPPDRGPPRGPPG